MEIGDSAVTINFKPIQTEIVDFYCNNVEIVCRICLERIDPDSKMCHIFPPTKSVHISTMIMACAAVQLAEGDGLPSTICGNCLTNLHIAWKFKVQCENSDLKLRQYYINQQQKQFVHNFDSVHISVKHDNYSDKCDDAFAQTITQTHISVGSAIMDHF
ncbi:zinc-finger associated domain containing protein [Oryctes borbonicus]|uniref:Zinc-finger associated domain containing protein n=1 Tax=Oryctes borbonicus TaxID=1629725 RepID=A0A0T6BIW2_9SCAR|nr:zinc-finger associated domain containing protein [Oryctes borbonicus]